MCPSFFLHQNFRHKAFVLLVVLATALILLPMAYGYDDDEYIMKQEEVPNHLKEHVIIVEEDSM